jgi:hypothetical protein
MKTRLSILTLILVALVGQAKEDEGRLIGQWKSDGEVIHFQVNGTFTRGKETGRWEVQEKGGLKVTTPAGTMEEPLRFVGDQLQFGDRLYTRIQAVPVKTPNDRKVDELMASGRWFQSAGEWAMLVGFLFMAGALVYAAIHTYRKGFKLSNQSTLTGTPAAVVAGVLVLVAVALVVVGIVLFRGGRLF